MDAQYIVAPQCIICEVPVQRTRWDLKLLCDGCRKPANESSLKEFPSSQEFSHLFQRKFRIVQGGTKWKNPKLIDSFNYTYSVKRRGFIRTEWQCSYRPKNNPCKATVSERLDGTFVFGSKDHNHSAFAIKSRALRKRAVAVEPVKPVSVIVKEMLLKQLTETSRPSLPRPEYLVRTENRFS